MTEQRYLNFLNAEDCALLMIDHQTGTMLGVQDIRLDQFRSNVLALASIGKVHNLPTVITGSYVDGPNGPIMPELLEMFPDAPVISRPGWINSWEDPSFKAAVEATGRKKLIMAGVTTDVCLYFPVISALAEGYEVYAVYDASGCWDMMSQLTSCMRLQQAGAIVCNWTVIAAMLQRDWRRPTAEGTLKYIFGGHLPFYEWLSNNQNYTRTTLQSKSKTS
ncbi:isochorismatase family protein [Leptolyngbya sp. NIES-2104]|uniref:isochorismatase family protein n=1 Tax=Leptolyngbya sp. NIES-2104 TaxID=1552121 RepID=UPI0006EC66E3|nr:isochorismatase family protein [Leptolyngbya sp. NIES-2104]GAP96846.1 nicotinamidase family protein YcaC [Leptolyngbya sp. NIES-2104]